MSLESEKLSDLEGPPKALEVNEAFYKMNAADNDSKEWLQTTDLKQKQNLSNWMILFLAYQSIGVIYGDIGTSPLYVYSSTFTGQPDRTDLLGVLSMIIWSLTLIVTFKYIFFVLFADDNGEGGTFALFGLISRYANISWRDPTKANNLQFKRFPTRDLRTMNKGFRYALEHSAFLKALIGGLSIVGVCLIMSDGVLTPAQSVLGAIQGLTVKFPNLPQSAITGISEGILILLFIVQPFGTTKLAVAFAPIVIIWLGFNFIIGAYNLALYDHSVLQAFSPYWIYAWFAKNGYNAFVEMGGILLAFTGVEALFADLAHFSATSVRISWVCFTYPCLLIAYIGQAAFILDDATGTAWSNPFFACVPSNLFWFAEVIAILAAIVASQAMITGCFSILNQAMALSNFPTLRLIHTSTKFYGQVYVPAANWLLMIGTVIVTAAFPNTTSLGNAYGVCVVLVTFVTTCMLTVVTIIVWRWNIIFSIAFFLFFGFLDGAFLSSTLLKVPQGGWFTLVVAAALSAFMALWHWGKTVQWESEAENKETFKHLLTADAKNKSIVRFTQTGEVLAQFSGVAIVFDSSGFRVPDVYTHFVKRFGAIPQVSVFVHFRFVNAPSIPKEERYAIFRVDMPYAYRVIVRQGYNEISGSKNVVCKDIIDRICELIRQEPAAAPTPQLSDIESTLSDAELEINYIRKAQNSRVTYIMGSADFTPSPDKNIIHRIFISLFSFVRANTHQKKTIMYGIPRDELVEVGMVYEL